MWLSLKEWPFSNLMNLLMMEKEPCERLQNKSPTTTRTWFIYSVY